MELGEITSFPPGLFDNENIYLEVKVFSTSTGWETLSPRQRLISTPFAKKAGYASTASNADTLDGLHASDLFSTGDDYGRSGVAANLCEGTTALTDKYVNEGQSGSITNSMIVNDAVTSNKIADGAVGASDLSGNAVTSAKIQDGTIQQSDLSFSVPDGNSLDAPDGDPVDAVYVDASGNVGIGTTTPGAKLDVVGIVNATTFSGAGILKEHTNTGYQSEKVTSIEITTGSPYTYKVATYVVPSALIGTRYVNVVVYAASSAASPGAMLKIEQDYGRLSVLRFEL